MTTTRALAAAILATALSGSALAADPASSIAGDPTWPDNPSTAPAIALAGTGDRADVLSDPTWPPMTVAAPAIVLSPRPAARSSATAAAR